MWEWGRGAGTGTEETGTTKAGGKGKQKTLPLAYGGHVPEPTLKNEIFQENAVNRLLQDVQSNLLAPSPLKNLE